MGSASINSSVYNTAQQRVAQIALLQTQLQTAPPEQKQGIATQITAIVSASWHELSIADDQYANVAYQGINDPSSFWGRAIRATWNEAGVNSGTFGVNFANVAADHFQNYVNIMSQSAYSMPDGSRILPKTTDIETSYASALMANGLPVSMAIDYLIETSYIAFDAGFFHWYTPDNAGVPIVNQLQVALTPSRIGPTSSQFNNANILDRLASIFHIKNIVNALEESGNSLAVFEAEFLSGNIAPKFGEPTQQIEQIGGLILFRDYGTGIFAVFDQSFHGYIIQNGVKKSIDSGNFRYNSEIGALEYYGVDLQWHFALNVGEVSETGALRAASYHFGTLDALFPGKFPGKIEIFPALRAIGLPENSADSAEIIVTGNKYKVIFSSKELTNYRQIDPETGILITKNLHIANGRSGVLDQFDRKTEYEIETVDGIKIISRSISYDSIDPDSGKPGIAVVKAYSPSGEVINSNIVIANNPIGIEFSQAGSILGQQLGYRLANGDALSGVIYSATLQTIGDNFGDLLDGAVGGQAVKHSVDDAFAATGHEFITNLKSAGIGAISSFLTAELVSSLGINGFAGELANSSAGYAIGQIITNIADMGGVINGNATSIFDGLSFTQLGNVVGGFLGSKLASEIVHFDTIGGQIGSAVGSALGSIGAVALVTGSGSLASTFSAFGVAAGPIGAAIGAFLGFIVGGLIGSIFGGTPRSGADTVWDASQQKFAVANVWSRKGGSKDAARSVATAVSETFNSVLAATGGTLLNPLAVQSGSYGMRKKNFVYRPTGGGSDQGTITETFSGDNAAVRLIGYGVFTGLTDPDFQIMGGDVYVKRALYNTFTIGGLDPRNFDTNVLLGNLSSAQQYESYLANSTVINALVSAEPNSVMAIETLLTLARADELGLTRRAVSDWTGGFSFLLQEAQTSSANVDFGFDYDPSSGQISRLIGIGQYTLGDTIDIAGQTTIQGTVSAETIDLRTGTLSDQRGYAVNGHLNNDIAVSGTDFTAATTTVTFAATDLRKTVTVTIANDGVAEAVENFNASLSNAPDMQIMGGTATATIVDGTAALPTLMVGDSYAYENDGYAVFRLSLSKAATSAVTVSLALGDGRANGLGVDYGSTSASNIQLSTNNGATWFNATTTTIAANSSAFILVRTPVIADNSANPTYVAGNGQPQTLNVEGNQTFSLNATVTAGAASLANGTQVVSGTGTIIDGAATQPLVWIDNVILDEASGQAQFTVSRSRTLAASTTVSFATSDNRALGIDIAATVDGGDGNDTIYASNLGDNLFGGAGDDTLYGGKLDDWLMGGDGNDVLDAGTADMNAPGGNGNYLNGGAGNDILQGREGSDWLEGGDGVDTLTGGGGGDILAAGGGTGDHSYGGGGGDQYIFRRGDGADFAEDGGGSAGTADSLAAAIAAKNANGSLKDWAGTGIYSENEAPYTGEDRVVLGAGIGLGDISLKRSGAPGAVGMDLIVMISQNGSATSDQLTLTGWFDSFKRVEWLEFADGQAVRIADFVSFTVGTAENDVLIGTNGSDFVVGGDGDDHLQLLGGDDVGIGGQGRDEIGGDDGRDILVGGSESDFVLGGSGNDVLSGDAGDDDLNGGAGNDIVSGGLGNDMIAGAGGDDIFRISRGDGRDTIIDDYAGTWDTVWTSSGSWNTAQGYAFNAATNQVTRNGTEVVYDGSNWLGRYNYDYATATSNGTLYRLVPDAGGQVGKDASTSDNDALEFALGINIQDLVLQKSGNDLLVGISSENAQTGSFATIADQITLKDWFVNTTANSPIERFVFAATGTLAMTATTTSVQGGDGNDLLNGTSGVDWMTGGAGDDSIAAGSGDDILNGNSGQDTLSGYSGDDIIYGGADDDILIGGAGKDLLSGGYGNDTASYLNSGSVSAYLANSAMNVGDALGDSYISISNLTGGYNADRLGGDDGENVLNGALGDDILLGGLGNDIYAYDPSNGADTIQDGRFTVEQAVNTSGVLMAGYTTSWTYNGTTLVSGVTYYVYRLVVTGPGSEIVYDGTLQYTTQTPVAPPPSGWSLSSWKNGFTRSNSANQQIIREKIDGSVDGGSEDVLEFGKGISLADLSLSWTGNDLTFTSQGSVKIVNQAIANQRIETLQLNDGLSADLANLRLNMSGSDNIADLIFGTTGADTLSGLSGNDVISGGTGNDTLNGGDGDDALEGGAGTDMLSGGAGVDTARYVSSATGVTIDLNLTTGQVGGDAAGDVLTGIENVVGSIAGNDILTGDALDNQLSGLDGNDTITGNAGNDVLLGELGADNLSGGDGDDNIGGGDGNDTASGGNGNDLLDGGYNNDTLHGDAGNDILSGGEGDDALTGDAGDDILNGGLNNDNLWGGDGNDIMSGDAGNDSLRGEAGNDIYLFSANSGTDTVIDITGVNEIGFDDSVDWHNVWLARVGNNLTISIIGGTSQITLSNYYATTNPTSVRRIAAKGYDIYLAYAQPLIDQMSAIALVAPAAMPASVAAAQGYYWWDKGLATPVVAPITLATNEDVPTPLQGTGAIDHDENITGYAIGSPGLHGTATINAATGQFSYLADPNYFGMDSFTIIVTDADKHSVEQTINVTINPVNDAPSDVTVTLAAQSAGGIPENITGATVGDLTAIDVDLAAVSDFGQSIFTTADSRFEVIGGKTLKLRAGQALDFEATPTVSVVVRATDRNGAGLSFDKTLVFTVADVVDVLNGTAMADTLTGAQGVDQIFGLDGNDTLRGGVGNDLIDGGNGNDSLFGEDGNDSLIGGTGIDTLDGGIGDDTLSGGTQNDNLSGRAGNDVLNGDANDDTLYGDAGNDTLNGGDGDDTLIGGAGADQLIGGLGTDLVSYRWINQNVASTAPVRIDLGNFALNTADAFGDTFTGIEIVEGTDFADTISGDTAANTLYGAAGNDTLYGNAGNDTIDGNDGNDILWGGDGNDSLYGGNGDDQLNAEAGDDSLDGGAGNDLMVGGAGNDTYIILRSSGLDTINNFHTNADDNDVLGYRDSIQDSELWFQRNVNDLVISVIGTTATTTIKDWYLAANLADQTNYQIKFITTETTRIINLQALVDLMKDYTIPTSLAAHQQMLLPGSAYRQAWDNSWGNNPPPVLSSLANINKITSEDTPLSFTVHATDLLDPNNPAAPSQVFVQVKVYNITTGLEDYSILSSAIGIGAADYNFDRSITLNPVANKEGTARVRVWAYDAGGRYSDEQVFDVSVSAKADMPVIGTHTAGASGNGKGTFNGGSTIPLNIGVSFPDADGSETQTILVTGVPAGLSLNQGSYNSTTSTWTLTPAQLTGLAVTGPATWHQNFTLSVTAKAVEASNGDSASTTAQTISVVVNAAPTDITLSGSITENPAQGAGGVTLTAVDPDGGAFTYSLSNNATNRFAINSTTGALTVLTATPSQIDYEASAGHTYAITVVATDSEGLSFSKSLNVPIIDQNERPAFTPTSYVFSGIAENSGEGSVVGTVTATDPDTYTASYGTKHYYFAGSTARASADGSFSVSSVSPDGKFNIDVNTGQIRVNASLNYEAQTQYNETVYVTDDLNNASARMQSAAVQINVTDVNEAPIFNSLNIGINEQIFVPMATVATISATDPDNDPAKRNLYYTLSGTNSDYFLLNNTTGGISLLKSLDYEGGPRTFNLTVGVWDQGNGAGNYVTGALTITVNNVNEQPVISLVNWSYNTGWPITTLSATVSATDPDGAGPFGGPFIYSVINGEAWDGTKWIAAAPSVNSSTGNITATGYNRRRFTARATDSGGLIGELQVDLRNSYYTGPPVILDLDGDGVELTSIVNSTARFDMNNDGVRDITGWAGADDGILAIDLNQNGEIDDASEISFQPNLNGAISDLEGLRAYDSNENGFIDSGDEHFADFKVWQDINQDGISQTGELRDLDGAGIAAINLTLTPTGAVDNPDAPDNTIYATSEYVRTDGTTGVVGDAFFKYLTDETTVILGAHNSVVGVDLDGNGVAITSLASGGISFDMAGVGATQSTAWVGAGDAMLAIDLDGDGAISTGAELALGDTNVPLSPLHNLDSNQDGVFDAGDAQFGSVVLWQDANQDAISQSSELRTLSEAGIDSIDLGGPAGSRTVGSGESTSMSDLVVHNADGSTGAAGNLLLAYSEVQIAAPIVFDYDNDGAGLVPLAGSPTRFDMNGDGILDQTGWIEAGDALLALDRNGNGVVDDIDEISFVGDLAGATTDLQGLAAFDSNADGFIDSNDAAYGNFRLWFDSDADGLTDTGELKTLAEAGVTEISLSRAATGETANSGANIVYNIGSYAHDGAAGRLLDAGFAFVAGTATPPTGGGTTSPVDGGTTSPGNGGTPALDPFPAITFQDSTWELRAKRYHVASISGGLYVRARSAEGVIDAAAGLVSPATIMNFADRQVGMLSTIIVDLDGDGLEARQWKKTGAMFDMDGNGQADNTGWVSGGDGLLVVDRNGDGAISDNSEIAFLSEKTNAKNAWDALAALDNTKDGKLSAADARFGTLKVWKDSNGNGISESGEIRSLADLGILEIGLGSSPADASAKLGSNVPLSTSTFKWTNGVTSTIGNVALAFDPGASPAPPSAGALASQAAASQLLQAMSSFGANLSDGSLHHMATNQQNRLDLLAVSAA